MLGAALSILALGTAPAAAQTPEEITPVSTGRPGFGSATSTLMPGRVQLETGTPGVSYDHFFEDRGVGFEGPITLERDTRLINFPTLLRVGVTNGLELRLGSTVYNFTDTDVTRTGTGVPRETSSSSDEGFGGLDVGAKLQLLGPRGALTGLVLVPTVTLPVGDGPFAARKTAFFTELDASFALGSAWGLGTYTALALNPGSGSDYLVSGTLAAALSRSLTRRLGGYVEGGYLPAEQSENAAYAGGGFTFLLSPTAQLDVNVDREVTATTGADWLFGFGVSIRFGD